jgi:hypothetical protein
MCVIGEVQPGEQQNGQEIARQAKRPYFAPRVKPPPESLKVYPVRSTEQGFQAHLRIITYKGPPWRGESERTILQEVL